ncbi:MAG: hypothetical protein M0R46_12870 [Candidatus Muirbacterium halophilum]|nr:hypothetical protein [Candidatus Muirbacterium halophilum]
MKYIKTFNENINISEIEAICKKYNIKNYIINEDGSIDVDGDVDLYKKKLKVLPLKFRKVSGNFHCNYNQLISLEGAPQSIGGNFYCRDNKLTSLVGCPQSVGGDFYCSYNQLISLEGAPQSIGWDFYCSNNKLISLEGAPQRVDGNFECGSNKLTTLEGAPQRVDGNFYCCYNQLTSLVGAPKRVGDIFFCYSNNLKNIDYLPKYYKELDISNNPIFKIIKLFITTNEYVEISNREDKDLIMDFIDREIIQQDKLLVNRLVEFSHDIGKPKSKEELIELLKNDYEIR